MQYPSIYNYDYEDEYDLLDNIKYWKDVVNSTVKKTNITRPRNNTVIFHGDLDFRNILTGIIDRHFTSNEVQYICKFNGSVDNDYYHTYLTNYTIHCRLENDETIGKFEFVMTSALYEYGYDYKKLLAAYNLGH